MGESLLIYLEKLELIAFFAGFPLIYALIIFVAGEHRKRSGSFMYKVTRLLPYTYALTASLYLGFLINGMYPDFSFDSIKQSFLLPYLKIWGLTGILFWIPALSRRTVFSLVHSMVFFCLLMYSLWELRFVPDLIQNHMTVYTSSLMIHAFALIFICIVFFIPGILRKLRHRVAH